MAFPSKIEGASGAPARIEAILDSPRKLKAGLSTLNIQDHLMAEKNQNELVQLCP